MRTLFFTIALIAAATAGTHAQSPVLQKGLFPTVGDTEIYYNATDTSAREGAAGTDKSWDFTIKSNASQRTTEIMRDVASTPYAAQFPQANVAVYYPADDSYMYLNTNDSQYLVAGYVVDINGSPATQPYTDLELQVRAPMAYGDTLIDSFSGTYNLAGFNVLRTGYTRTEVDAYGTLTLNGTEHSNVLRLHIKSHIKDSFNAMGTPQFIVTDLDRYEFRAEGEKSPLMAIEYNIIAAMGDFQQFKTVEVRDDHFVSGIEDNGVQFSGMSVFPNPARNHINLQFSNDMAGTATLELLDLQGRQLQTRQLKLGTAGQQQQRMDVSWLQQGVYLLRLSSGSQVSVQKIVVR